jgi:hypothetical protein
VEAAEVIELVSEFPHFGNLGVCFAVDEVLARLVNACAAVVGVFRLAWGQWPLGLRDSVEVL